MMKTDLLPTPTSSEPEPIGPPPAPSSIRSGRRVLRFAVSAVLVLGILSGGVGGFYWLLSTKPAVQRSNDSPLPPLVEVQTLVPEDLKEVFVGYGSARADREVTISAEAAGQVIEVPAGIKDGAIVKPGELLVRIDDRQAQRQLDKERGRLADVQAQLARLDVERTNVDRLIATAEDEVKITRGEYERLSKLHEKNLASRKEWNFARLAYQSRLRELQGLQNQRDLIPAHRAELLATRDARRADVAMARLACERCTILAPQTADHRLETGATARLKSERAGPSPAAAWQIDKITVESGDRVQVGGQIVHLVGTRFVEVPIELPLSARTKTRPQARCVLTMDSMPGVQWRATVKRLSPLADTHSRTFIAYLEVDNAEQSTPLVPGYFLTARITGPTIHGALAIPRGVILMDKVFVVNSGKAHLRHVRVVQLISDRAVISGEVAAGDQVILTNLDALSEGAPVRWQKRKATTKEPADETTPNLISGVSKN